MGKFKFTFTNILFWVAVICSILIFENITFFTESDPANPIDLNMGEVYFFIIYAIAALCYFFLILYETIYNKAKANYVALVICLALLGCGVAGIMLFNGMTFTNSSSEIVVTEWEKMKHIMSFTLFVVTAYCTIFYFTNNHPSIRRLRFLFIAVTLATYFFIIYSLATEFDKYSTIANAEEAAVIHNLNITSLFLNPNMYAAFILMGVCAAIGLNYYKKNVYSYICIIGFTIVQIFVCSLTSTLITLVVMFIYFLSEIIMTFKKKKASSMVKLAIMLLGYVAIVVIFAVCQSYYVKGLSPFLRFLYEEISSSDYHTLSHRVEIWNNALYASNRNIFTLLFGYGYKNSEYVLGGLVGNEAHRISCHNGYLQCLLNFGIVGLFALAMFFGYYLYCLIRMFKKDLRFALVFLTLGLAYFAVGVTESFIAFAPGAQGLLIAALFYLPVITKWRHLKDRTAGDAIIDRDSPRILEPKLMVRGATVTLLSLMSVGACFFVIDEFRTNIQMFYSLLNIEVLLGMLLLTLPYLNGLWAKCGDPKKYAVSLIIFLLTLLIVGGGLYVPMFFPSANIMYSWMLPIVVGFILLVYVIASSAVLGGSVELYMNTFVGIKTALPSLIGIAGYCVGLSFVKGYLLPYSPVMMGLVALGALLTYTCFKLIIPFKDTVAIAKYACNCDAELMKRDVVRDRLERSVL